LNKTYLIVISPDCEITPNSLFHYLVSLGLQITIKQTCFGVFIEGEKEELDKAINKVIELEPNKLFIKERGYPIGDSRICRMKQKGGPRPGLLQLEAEYQILPFISDAMSEAQPKIKVRRKKKRVHVREIMNILNAEKDTLKNYTQNR